MAEQHGAKLRFITPASAPGDGANLANIRHEKVVEPDVESLQDDEVPKLRDSDFKSKQVLFFHNFIHYISNISAELSRIYASMVLQLRPCCFSLLIVTKF
jgi:hypothetical protein